MILKQAKTHYNFKKNSEIWISKGEKDKHNPKLS